MAPPVLNFEAMMKPNRLSPLAHQSQAAFTLVDSVVGMMLVSVLLSCLFAANTYLLGLLKQGKESTYATQIIQERVEQLRTALWDSVTDPAKIVHIASPATATATNLQGVTETITVESLINPATSRVCAIRAPSGATTISGTALDTERSVKVTVRVEWESRHHRIRSRESVTLLTKDGI